MEKETPAQIADRESMARMRRFFHRAKNKKAGIVDIFDSIFLLIASFMLAWFTFLYEVAAANAGLATPFVVIAWIPVAFVLGIIYFIIFRVIKEFLPPISMPVRSVLYALIIVLPFVYFYYTFANGAWGFYL